MKKIILSLAVILTLTASTRFVSAADPTPAESAPATEAVKEPKNVPFRGTVSNVDPTAGTFTIANKENTKVRVFDVKHAASLTRDDKVITIEEVKVGDYARGSGVKVEKTKMTVNTAKFGPKTADEIAADEAKKEKKAAAKAAAEPGN
jgi:hypothetical protein